MKQINIPSLVRDNIRKLKPYSSARDEFEGNASVFLDANESPYSNGFNRYPDPHQKELKSVISQIKNAPADNIFLGNGSDEAIDLLFRIFCEPGVDNVIIPQPSYGMYSVCADINNIKIQSPLLTKTFDLDAEQVLKSVNEKTKIIFLCSPNNPSGNLLNSAGLEKILTAFNGVVVIDEAYIDFTNGAGWSARLRDFNNLVILQTLSKAWGLAGLRLGICFADREIINLMNKVKPPYNISGIAQIEAIKVLTGQKEIKNQQVKEIISERQVLAGSLSALPGVKKVHPSDANFLLVDFENAREVHSKLVTLGIIVRDRSNVILCDNCLRITVGTKKENEKLIQALKAL